VGRGVYFTILLFKEETQESGFKPVSCLIGYLQWVSIRLRMKFDSFVNGKERLNL
jgi:hypothetical protein